MKTFPSILCSLFFTGTLMAGSPNVSIQVRTESENHKSDPKSKQENRSHWLVVRVTNPSSERLEGLELRWTLFADDLKRGTDHVVVEKSGSERFAVEAGGRYADVTTPKVAFLWTPLHSERTGSGRRSRSKKVDESGHRYHGYLVEVLKDGAVIGQATSHRSLLKGE